MDEESLQERYDQLSTEYDRKYQRGSKISTARVNAIKQLIEINAELIAIGEAGR
jgi:hypothetical protein